MKYKTFKELVKMISEIRQDREEDFNHAMWEIDMSYQHDKITWKDNELLYDLISMIERK